MGRGKKYQSEQVVNLLRWPEPSFPHRTEYDFRIQEGAGRCRGASIRRRR